MILRLSLALALLLAQGSPVLKTGVFASSEWTIRVPADYVEGKEAVFGGRTKTIAFAPVVRDDGTRSLIQITLHDVTGDEPPPQTLEKIGEKFIAGVRNRRDNWKVSASKIEINGTPVMRYEWSGITIPATDGAASRAPARGIMLVGLAPHILYSLSTQDVDLHADETLPANEQALRTFSIRSR